MQPEKLFLYDADSGGAGAGGGDQTPANNDAPPAGDPPASTEPGPVPYDRFKEVNEQAKTLRAELEKFKEAEEARAKKQAEEQGKWRDLYEQREKELAQERAARLRLEVASAKGLPVDLAARLQGSTKEELAEDAEALLKFMKPSSGPGVPPAGRGSSSKPLDLSNMSPSDIRENADKLFDQIRQ